MSVPNKMFNRIPNEVDDHEQNLGRKRTRSMHKIFSVFIKSSEKKFMKIYYVSVDLGKAPNEINSLELWYVLHKYRFERLFLNVIKMDNERNMGCLVSISVLTGSKAAICNFLLII